jgi:hypothetical protein
MASLGQKNSRDTWRTDSELRTGNATSLMPLHTADRHPEISRRDLNHTPKGFCSGRFFGTDLRESRDDRCALAVLRYDGPDMRCDDCDLAVDDGDRYCSQCGAYLAVEPGPADRELLQLSQADFLTTVASGLPLIWENASRLWTEAAEMSQLGARRSVCILRGFAEEEGAKALILLDAIRCPASLVIKLRAECSALEDLRDSISSRSLSSDLNLIFAAATCSGGSDQSRTKTMGQMSATRINTGARPSPIKVCKTFTRRFDPSGNSLAATTLPGRRRKRLDQR